MQAAHLSLTAQLMGDPHPRRLENAERLRRFAVVKEDDASKPTAQERRDMILAAVKDGPITAQQIHEVTGLEIDSFRPDLQSLRRAGLLIRSGRRVGFVSTVRWRLPGTPEGEAPQVKLSFEIRMEAVLALLAERPGLSSDEVRIAIDAALSSTQATLKTAREQGLVVTKGQGPFLRYYLAEGQD